MTARRYAVVAWIAFASLYVIIITGSLVRLTGSGLGCSDWPRCNESRFIDVSSTHAAIEQLNRLFTGVVAASVIAAALGALRVAPRRSPLVRHALLLVAGVIGQVVLGGIVVITGLHPAANMGHYLLSVALMTWAYWLVRDARALAGSSEPVVAAVSRGEHSLISWLMAAMAAALVTGTVVTGTGPHAGDENAPRFDFAVTSVARVHSLTVLGTLVLAVVIGFRLRNAASPERRQVVGAFESFLFVAVLQGGLGYLQYFTGVPVPLVALHVALSVAVWLAVLHLRAVARPVLD